MDHKLSITWLATHIGTIDGFLDDQECADLIADSERRGFEEARINNRGNALLMKDLRNNDRIIFDDEDLADLLFARARPVLYRGLGEWRLKGLNERFRFYRYGPGQKFDWHHDGTFVRTADEHSQFTFMIYLSDDFEGGGTSFRGAIPGYEGNRLTVKPRKGMALAFYHPIEHRGDEVLSGRKYDGCNVQTLRIAGRRRIALQRVMDHLRYSGLPFDEQRTAFFAIVSADPLVRDALARGRTLNLPDWLVVSGALYNSVWNHLTGKPSGYGMKDVDLFYFDDSDLSYEAEDAVIQRASLHFEGLAVPVEVRNQARVHLWYPEKFGQPCPRYTSSSESVSHFASKTHAVGVRYDAGGQLELVAPFGLDDVFSFRITPNRVTDNQRTHEAKGARAKACWPEIEVVGW